jgi:hypothetical protein
MKAKSSNGVDQFSRGASQGYRSIGAARPVTRERAVEMLMHAYIYVRQSDPTNQSGAAEVLWSKYKELRRTQQLASRKKESQ